MPTTLAIIESWGPGGAETIFLDLATELRSLGWNCVPVVGREGWLSTELRQRGFVPVLSESNVSFDVNHVIELTRLIRHHDVDIVHTHLLEGAVYGGLAGTVTGTPVVSTFHGIPDAKGVTGWRRVKIPLIERFCDRKVFVSGPLRRDFGDRVGMRTEDSSIVWNGIDLSRFLPGGGSEFREALGFGPSYFVVGAVGNLRPAKNYDAFLRMAAHLCSMADDYQFVIVGDKEPVLYDHLVRRRDELNLGERVLFAGFREDVADVLRGLDAFALTSETEGFSLTTVQAMAMELPVVATRCGGPEAIVDDGRTGFLVEREAEHTMAEILHRLRLDNGLRRRVGVAARKSVVMRFSLQRMVEEYRRIYESLTEVGN